MSQLQLRMRSVLVAAVLACVASTTVWADLTAYSQDFEGLNQADLSALSNDGWVVFGNVFDGSLNYLYGYGPYSAPNNSAEPAFCLVAAGQGGSPQGAQQLVVFSDYKSLEHNNPDRIIESNVFHEQTIGAGDVGKTYVFRFDAKLGDLEGSSTALAFFKTLDPNAGYALTNFVSLDMTSIPVTWGTYSLLIPIDASLNGQLLQFGFLNTASTFQPSGVFYDNVTFREARTSDSPPTPLAFELHQNVPNPFNPVTRINFDLMQRDDVDVSVYDVAGRWVVTLYHGQLEEGPHDVIWNGRSADGTPAAAGVYWYVLETSTARTSRSMVLMK